MNTSTNTTLDYSTESPTFPVPVDYPVILVVWIIVDKVLVVVTNGTTLMILLKYAMLETATNIFICCLTLADLTSAVALPFTLASIYLLSSLLWNICCFANIYMLVIAGMMNGIILCAIAVERLFFLVYALEYHTLLPLKRAKLISCAIWVSVMLYSLVVISVGYRDASMDGVDARPCRLGLSVPHGVVYLAIPIFILVPMTIGCYIKITLAALEQKRRIAAMNIPHLPPSDQVQSDSKITKVMLRVLLVYILCTASLFSVPILYHFCPEPVQLIGLNVAFLVWRINTWLNPFIYAWKSDTFRKHLKTFFGIGPRHNNYTTNVSEVA